MLRIGELARRTGVSPELLRAWERRYGLLEPVRSDGGYRLYGPADERRIVRMQELLARGYSAAEAAGLAAGGDEPEPDLLAALLALDEERAQGILDELLGTLTPEAVLQRAVLPALRGLGEATIAQEHFGSNLIRGRLLALARRWDQGIGPRALLACAPGELHDLPLIVFGLALHRRGWRILFLGSDTPLETLETTARAHAPDVVVLASMRERHELDLGSIAAVAPLALAGRWPPGAAAAIRLEGDPVEAATTMSAWSSSAARSRS